MAIKDFLKNEKPKDLYKPIDVVRDHFEELYSLREEKYSYAQLHEAFIKETELNIQLSTFRTYYKSIKTEKGLTKKR